MSEDLNADNRQVIRIDVRNTELVEAERKRTDEQRLKAEELQKQLDEANKQIETLRSQSKGATGSAPPNQSAGGQPFSNIQKGYSDYAEMMADLRVKERSGDCEATKTISAFYEKMLKDSKNAGLPLVGSNPVESISEYQNRLYRQQVKRERVFNNAT
jgi:hypothetical protein